MNQEPEDGARKRLEVFTVGHSTRSLEELVLLLRAHGVGRVVDVRTIPRSRHNPQFNHEELSRGLHSHGIHYRHISALGGLRHARRDSTNTGWRNDSFRGFADYMQTREFERGIEELMALAETEPTAVMCAEAVPWRCHRSLIADALVARGVVVHDLLNPTKSSLHRLTPFAVVRGQTVTYPGEQAERSLVSNNRPGGGDLSGGEDSRK